MGTREDSRLCEGPAEKVRDQQPDVGEPSLKWSCAWGGRVCEGIEEQIATTTHVELFDLAHRLDSMVASPSKLEVVTGEVERSGSPEEGEGQPTRGSSARGE
jgi:hypothetical protein